MASPLLLIRRIVVKGELSCDIEFSRGLNVISAVGDPKSTNKVGKTSLVELIQHGLGRRQKSRAKFYFEPLMDRLESLWLEIELNGKVYTIERSMQIITGAMRVREGAYFAGIETVPSELISVEDMSTFFLQMLNIPVVSVKKADGDLDALSFPLLMRSFILHQEDSFGGILDKVVPEQRKTDILGFLSRTTPEGRFELEDRLGAVQRDAQELRDYFSSVSAFLIANGVPSYIEAAAQVRNAEESLEATREVQREIQRGMTTSAEAGSQQPGKVKFLRETLLKMKERIAQVERSVAGLNSEEERLADILASLEVDRKKAQRLQVSSTILSSVEFTACPRCLLNITEEMRQREQHARCSLCNRPLRTTSDALPRSIPRVDDIDLQISEAREVLADIKRELREAQRELEQQRAEEQIVAQQLDQEILAFVSPAIDRLLYQAHIISQQEAKLGQARALLAQAQALNEIRERLQLLELQQAELEDELSELNKTNRTRLTILSQNYDRILRTLGFPSYRSSSIDTKTLMPNINGSLYIHTGTALKGLATVAYHLALFDFSRQEDTFFPRMLVIDSPGVGDLNDENHDQLLRYIAAQQPEKNALSDELDWQIILTTRRMVDELQPYVCKELSAPDRMLLQSR